MRSKILSQGQGEKALGEESFNHQALQSAMSNLSAEINKENQNF